ncbi:hypothetical protein HanLR1_Chr00c3269g0873111 [Helianthus annuus]|nr:hypothetical protein HanLR1_Chr00c3269g0873111 [Helianthus annuus]
MEKLRDIWYKGSRNQQSKGYTMVSGVWRQGECWALEHVSVPTSY